MGSALAGFNQVPAAEAERRLRSCCAARRWARELTAGRPYPDLGALLAASDAVLGRLGWADVAEAVAAHPRIGDRVTGTGQESAWSRREQSGLAGADPATRAALVQVNQAYEERFDRTFLIFASGRSETDLLAAARQRLSNDEATERGVVRAELAKITRLRLERLLSETMDP